MQQILNVFISCMTVFLAALELCMLARAVLNWLPLDEESAVYRYLFCVTEPLVLPVRAIFDRIPAFGNSPIDVSFFITLILLSVISSLLSGIPVTA